MKLNPDSQAARYAEVAMLYASLGSMQQVAKAIGLSRQRVHQLLLKTDYTPRYRRQANAPDPLRICQAAETALSVAEVARVTKTPYEAVRRVLSALGKIDDIHARARTVRVDQTRKRLARQLHGLAQKLGRTPSQLDLLAAGICHTSYYHYFGSLAGAQRALGLTPNGLGGAPTLRVSVEEQDRMIADYKAGKARRQIERETGRSPMTVHDVLFRRYAYRTNPEKAVGVCHCLECTANCRTRQDYFRLRGWGHRGGKRVR